MRGMFLFADWKTLKFNFTRKIILQKSPLKALREVYRRTEGAITSLSSLRQTTRLQNYPLGHLKSGLHNLTLVEMELENARQPLQDALTELAQQIVAAEGVAQAAGQAMNVHSALLDGQEGAARM